MKGIHEIIVAAAVLLLPWGLRADEGMWLPSLIGQRIEDMQAKGFKLSAEDIYSVNQASLKDAVVLFGRGCTGELISSEGLLLTNHHCGYSLIQKHSSVEHDYLKDGFWAMSREEELPNPGFTVSFLDRMEDVTSQVLKGYKPSMSEAQREKLVKKNSEKIIKKAVSKGKGLQASVEALYYGNQYFLFVYKVYRDIRLVGAPPSSIGKFGGDTDNWMWPRHTGDFSIFRIYADANNEPADYSESNVPYRPKKHFKISLKGVKEGNFTFIYGYPGRTQEYIMSEGVRYIAEVFDPQKIALRTERLNIQNKYMSADHAVRIQYSSKNAGVANSWKKWQGESKGIKRLCTVAEKQAYEARFKEWAKGGPYEGVVERLDSLYKLLEPYAFMRDIYSETVRTVELASFAYNKGDSTAFYKDYYMPIDREIFVSMTESFGRLIPEAYLPEYYKVQLEKYGSVEAWSEAFFADESLGLAAEYYRQFENWYKTSVAPEAQRIECEITLLNRDYMQGQMEFEPSRAFYPDANLTLRVAYGHVSGYQPADAIHYAAASTLDGIMEKDNPEIFDYNIPQRLRDIYAAKDYGPWVNEEGKVPVCFIATNHTSGGNSGSPVINADGNLMGINFDRVWEGTMSDLVFDPDYCRNISLDIRYVLFIIDKLAGAQRLLDEMDFE